MLDVAGFGAVTVKLSVQLPLVVPTLAGIVAKVPFRLQVPVVSNWTVALPVVPTLTSVPILLSTKASLPLLVSVN